MFFARAREADDLRSAGVMGDERAGMIELGQDLREDAGGVDQVICEDAVGDFRGAGAGPVVEVAFRDRLGTGGDGCCAHAAEVVVGVCRRAVRAGDGDEGAVIVVGVDGIVFADELV